MRRYPVQITNRRPQQPETWPKVIKGGVILLIVLLALIFFIFPAMDAVQ